MDLIEFIWRALPLMTVAFLAGGFMNRRKSPAEEAALEERRKSQANMRLRIQCPDHGDVLAQYVPVCPQCEEEACEAIGAKTRGT